MARTGERVSFLEFEHRSNQLARLLMSHGLSRGDHYAIFMENHLRYFEACGAGERAGMYYTCINSHLRRDELAYIINNSRSKVVITSRTLLPVALDAFADCPQLQLCLVVDGGSDIPETAEHVEVADYAHALTTQPADPLATESLGTNMLYSSGTTGRPKGILRELDCNAPSEPRPLVGFLRGLWHYREGMVYLAPAPLYHSAPQIASNTVIRTGGTIVLLEKFDPQLFLEAVERYRVTHTQVVPTMFTRLLKLPDSTRTRVDLGSLQHVVHAAAPCPPEVKRQIIEWFGPIVDEYYSSTEALGLAACDSAEWLRKPGTVGRILFGTLHVLDDEMTPCPPGVPGTLWFDTPTPLRFFDDAEASRDASSADGTMATTGDIGYLDDDGYLFLTDRTLFTIIAGGVNIYPREIEDILILHPSVADVAVVGVPNQEFGEEVKAVVQVEPGVVADDALRAELIDYCRARLASYKCPRSVDFDDALPRTDAGKLYKGQVRDRYWRSARASPPLESS